MGLGRNRDDNSDCSDIYAISKKEWVSPYISKTPNFFEKNLKKSTENFENWCGFALMDKFDDVVQVPIIKKYSISNSILMVWFHEKIGYVHVRLTFQMVMHY